MWNLGVETSTGLPLDPMVGLGILRDSLIFRLFPVLVELNLASPSS